MRPFLSLTSVFGGKSAARPGEERRLKDKLRERMTFLDDETNMTLDGDITCIRLHHGRSSLIFFNGHRRVSSIQMLCLVKF